MCCIALHNICISRNVPCAPKWKLEVKELNLVRKPTKRTNDKKLFDEIRDRVLDWLWSLYN